MKSALRREIWTDFICIADFILAQARISFQKGSVVVDNQLPQSLFCVA
jgi:hypothetical protein